MPTLAYTAALIIRLFANRFDKSHAPYHLHPVAAMNLLPSDVSDDVRHAALLHDVMEDCGVTADDLRAYGYSEAVITAVALVSRKPDETYVEFIDRIIASGNRDAMLVKIADMTHNMDKSRLNGVSLDTRLRVERMIEVRYRPSLEKLIKALKKENQS